MVCFRVKEYIINFPRYMSKFLKSMMRGLKKLIKFFYDGCERLVERFFTIFQFDNREGVNKVFKKTKRIVLIIIILLVVIFVLWETISNCFFIVSPGSSAAIVTLGRFTGDAQPGLHFYIPSIERYYIVDTGNLMEIQVGFTPDLSQILDSRYLFPVENQVQQQYEQSIIQADNAVNKPLSVKGSFLQSLNKPQRLPMDYLKESGKLGGMVAASSLSANNQQGMPSQKIQYNSVRDFAGDKYITADLSIVRVSFAVQYMISDISDYLFKTRDVRENIQDFARVAMSQALGNQNFSYIITTGRPEIERVVKERLQQLLDKVGVGIKIKRVIILSAIPPQEVISVFNQIGEARQTANKTIYESQILYNRTIPAAAGLAQRIKAEAAAYAIKVVNDAQGQSGRFNFILSEYKKAPAITENRLYLDALQNILNTTPNMIVDPKIKSMFIPLVGNVTGQAQKNAALPVNSITHAIEQLKTDSAMQVQTVGSQAALNTANMATP